MRNTNVAGLLLRPFQQFVATESASGLVLLASTLAALIWANSPAHEGYFHLWEQPLTIGAGAGALTKTLEHWINDGLMVVFFLLVGLEIKRESLGGELASRAHATLPVAGAIGGMIVPALIYFAFNAGEPGVRGWGIPMATDIAFALGVVSLLGDRIPVGLKVFLAALAIVDDIGAVLVIAVFYTSDLSGVAVLSAAIILAALVVCNRRGVRSITVYAVLGVALWIAVLRSGIHATIAGVLLAMTIPYRVDDDTRSPLLRVEQSLHGVVAFAIMPLFAFANAGIRISAEVVGQLSMRVVLGVALGLVVGKVTGILCATWLSVKSGAAALPNQVTWRSVFGVSWLGGIGFTMSLFVATLAFGSGPLLDSAKFGILAASILAGMTGAVLLARREPQYENGSGHTGSSAKGARTHENARSR